MQVISILFSPVLHSSTESVSLSLSALGKPTLFFADYCDRFCCYFELEESGRYTFSLRIWEACFFSGYLLYISCRYSRVELALRKDYFVFGSLDFGGRCWGCSW